MPCKVDLMEGYKWYDMYDLADHMYFNTPLVPLMCEVMKLIESKELLPECSSLVQQWYVYHKEDDIARETVGKRVLYRGKEEQLKPFIQHMRDIGFTAWEGILTKHQKEVKAKEMQESRIASEKYQKEFDIKVAIQKERDERRKEHMYQALREEAGKELTQAERLVRCMQDVETIDGKRVTKLYLDDELILEYID